MSNSGSHAERATRAVTLWRDSKWEDAHFRGAAAPGGFVGASVAASESWLRTIVPNPSLAVLVANHTTSNGQSKQTAAREETMRYNNPDRRTILKTMTSLAAASSMAKITV